jgi:hypothetical protein
VAVVCGYGCRPGAQGEAGRSWAQALELAQAGFDVWLVTSSDHRGRIEQALDSEHIEGIHVLFWDAPGALRPLRSWRAGTRLHAALWYWIVGRAIDEWHEAVGMSILRRIVHPSRASVTYLVLPAVHRPARPRFSWRTLSD